MKWPVDEGELIFTTEDPEGRSIHLGKKQWEHVKESHTEISITVPKTRAIINRPDFITENLNRQSLAYTQITSLSLYYNIYVGMDDLYQEGMIRTVFFQGTPPRGSVIWTKE
ncbi:MAG: hypothetical protein HN342_14620 [Nitrospina sp.]|jgi:hypothetical protein|nr:hypothetical protein [Nitrospina sp.]